MQRRINITGRSTFSVLPYPPAEVDAVESASGDAPWSLGRVCAATTANAGWEDFRALPGFSGHEEAFGEPDLRLNV